MAVLREASYLNMEGEGEEEGEFRFVRYTLTNDKTLIMWSPKVEAFGEAVKEGKLRGVVQRERSSSHDKVTATRDEVNEFIDPKRMAEQFDIETPIVFTRLKK